MAKLNLDTNPPLVVVFIWVLLLVCALCYGCYDHYVNKHRVETHHSQTGE